MDLAVAEAFTLRAGESRDIPTGLKIELPPGVWGRITGRSSSLRKHGLFINEGVIDQGYRGELFVYVTNRNGELEYSVEAGTRLAQLILAPVLRASVVEVDSVSPSDRGDRGFGSTGHREWSLPLVEREPVDGFRQFEAAGPILERITTSEGEERVRVLTGHEAAVAIAEAHGDTTETPREKHPMLGASVYLGGPIDYVNTNPEQRHRRFVFACQMYDPRNAAFFEVYCPSCRKQKDETPKDAIYRNQDAVTYSDFAVFEWSPGVSSFGTPVEIYTRVVAERADQTFVVGDLGNGLFGQWLRELGVTEVASMEEAVMRIMEWGK